MQTMQTIGNTAHSFTGPAMVSLGIPSRSTLFSYGVSTIAQFAKVSAISFPMLQLLLSENSNRSKSVAKTLENSIIRISFSCAISIILTWLIDTRCAFRSLDRGFQGLLASSALSLTDSFFLTGAVAGMMMLDQESKKSRKLATLKTWEEQLNSGKLAQDFSQVFGVTLQKPEKEIKACKKLKEDLRPSWSRSLIGTSLIFLGTIWLANRACLHIIDTTIANGNLFLALYRGDIHYLSQIKAHLHAISPHLVEANKHTAAWHEALPMKTG